MLFLMQLSSKFPEKPQCSLYGVKSANLLQIYLEHQSREFWDAAGCNEFSMLEGTGQVGLDAMGEKQVSVTAQKLQQCYWSHIHCPGHRDGQQEVL